MQTSPIQNQKLGRKETHSVCKKWKPSGRRKEPERWRSRVGVGRLKKEKKKHPKMKQHCFVPSPECHSNNASYVLVSVSDSHRTSASRISGWHLLRQNALCACGVVLVPRKLPVSCYRRRQPGAVSRYSTGELPHSINLLPFKSAVHLGEFRKIALAHGPCSGKHL